MLEIQHVYKKYNKDYILKDINLKLPNHGLVSIIGESGSGKSTLLNLIGGLDKVSDGNIILNNNDITKYSSRELEDYYKNDLGFLFQSYNLVEYLTVKDNLSLISNDYDELLDKLNISHLKNNKVNTLSGGEKARVSLVRALLMKPSILLCDEPTGALDIKNSYEVMDILKELSKDILIIVVTHNKELANTYSDIIVELKDGVVNNYNVINKTKDIKINKHINKYRLSKILNIVINHFNNKRKRNIITSIAFSIGLISLGIVLSISSGFKSSLEYEEKNSLARYPIIINETSVNLDDKLDGITNISSDNNKVYSYDINHINKIDKNYINYIDEINDYLDYKIYKYNYNGYYINTLSSINTDKYYDEFNILYGNKIESKNDVLLLVDNNNRVDKNILLSIGLDQDDYSLDDLIDYSYYINKDKYTIKGIMKVKDDSIVNDLSGIIYDSNILNKRVPDEIYLYPKSYDDKTIILNHLDDYEDIKYTDYSTSIKSLSNTLMDGITIILIIFSSISLLVSTILIGILTYINVIENKKEIGIYKSLGLSNNHIKMIYYIDNIIIVLISCLLSILIICLISIPFNHIINSLVGLNNVMLLRIDNFIIMIILSIILSLIGSKIPINNISKFNIVDILRNE